MSRQQRPVGSGHTHQARVVDRAAAPLLGPANGEVDFFAYGACTRPGIDPALFTSEEDDHQAVAAARAVCRGCPVRLPCRRYAYQANPYGVYGGEIQAERVANLQAPRPSGGSPAHAGPGAKAMSVSVASWLRARPVAAQPPPRKADPHARTGTARHPRVGGGHSSSAGAASSPVQPARAAG